MSNVKQYKASEYIFTIGEKDGLAAIVVTDGASEGSFLRTRAGAELTTVQFGIKMVTVTPRTNKSVSVEVTLEPGSEVCDQLQAWHTLWDSGTLFSRSATIRDFNGNTLFVDENCVPMNIPDTDASHTSRGPQVYMFLLPCPSTQKIGSNNAI